MNQCDCSFDSTCSAYFALPLACRRRAALCHVQESTKLRAHHLGKIACGSLRDGNVPLKPIRARRTRLSIRNQIPRPIIK